MNLSTGESPASWMMKLFGEVGRDVSEYFSETDDVVKSYSKNVIGNINVKLF